MRGCKGIRACKGSGWGIGMGGRALGNGGGHRAGAVIKIGGYREVTGDHQGGGSEFDRVIHGSAIPEINWQPLICLGRRAVVIPIENATTYSHRIQILACGIFCPFHSKGIHVSTTTRRVSDCASQGIVTWRIDGDGQSAAIYSGCVGRGDRVGRSIAGCEGL